MKQEEEARRDKRKKYGPITWWQKQWTMGRRTNRFCDIFAVTIPEGFVFRLNGSNCGPSVWVDLSWRIQALQAGVGRILCRPAQPSCTDAVCRGLLTVTRVTAMRPIEAPRRPFFCRRGPSFRQFRPHLAMWEFASLGSFSCLSGSTPLSFQIPFVRLSFRFVHRSFFLPFSTVRRSCSC